jgi:UDP-N-acetylmuramoylalanine--D-glutamate ligase
VPVAHPVYRLAESAGVPIRSEIELAWERLSRAESVGAPAPPALVAITGTNGKTTVTTLVAAMLNASGRAAAAAGNIGLPLIDAVDLDVTVVVAEVSSFQLHYTERFHPAVSCWLNLAEDHLDWHPTPSHYQAAKARIWANQGEGDVVVLNRDDPAVMATADDPVLSVPARVRRVGFSLGSLSDFGVAGGRLVGPGGVEIASVSDLPRAFPHDLANDLAACATAMAAGASAAGCRQALLEFRGLPHRVQLVGEADGARWFDDSKATTPASVLAAVAGFDSVVLIAGGRNKGLDLGVLRGASPPVRGVIAIGEAAPEIQKAFDDVVPVTVAGTMADAVGAARRLARAGDAILLSPGCASFDWYRSYGERGDEFVALVTAELRRQETHS